jgi:hypothetical protein
MVSESVVRQKNGFVRKHGIDYKKVYNLSTAANSFSSLYIVICKCFLVFSLRKRGERKIWVGRSFSADVAA